jgi:hypothetical protein
MGDRKLVANSSTFEQAAWVAAINQQRRRLARFNHFYSAPWRTSQNTWHMRDLAL